MRILYIARDNPAVDTILSGMNDSSLSGLPAFYYPFKMLLNRGHTIDLLLFTYRPDSSMVESEHFRQENFIAVRLPDTGGMAGKIQVMRTIAEATKKQLGKKKYDFVYGLAEGAIIGVIEAQKQGVPCAYRQFGTYNDFEHGVRARKTVLGRRIESILHHTYAYIPMRAKMAFLLNTNDGSHQDLLFDMMKIRKQFCYFFWRSGIHVPESRPEPVLEGSGAYPERFAPMALVQISRYSPEKRQIRSVRILGELHRRGQPMHLYFVGNAFDENAQMTLLAEAAKWGVQDFVHFEGHQPQERAWQYARHSFACLLPNESGLVNVFYENLAQGAAVIASKTPTLDEFIRNGENGFQFSTEEEAAEYIERMLFDEDYYWRLRSNAYDTAQKKVLSIEKRFGMEVDLIEDAASGRPIDKYPERI